MEFSYWEYKSWLSRIDFTVVGSGIVGLNCALRLREKYPNAKTVVLEKGVLPQGASTKNAGFACFGSLSEILSDLRGHSREEVFALVRERWEGIQFLRRLLGDSQMHFRQQGGHEVFLSGRDTSFGQCRDRMENINAWLAPIFGSPPFVLTPNVFRFHQVRENYITHQYEGQLDTGKMMMALLALAHKKGIIILNSCTLQEFTENKNGVSLKTDRFETSTQNVFIATNGFARELISSAVQPARAQVLITKPIPDLGIRGTFHMDAGYYYFRNVGNRLLLGGGRNLDLKGEATTLFGKTPLIQNALEELLSQVILPETPFEIAHRWSGIMGIGEHKFPIVEQFSDRVFGGIRLGGMGVAIGSTVGRNLADLLS
ncbi:MAG: FAD-dependent oxidoreductase [Bacteroidota bacterium]